MKRVMSYVSIVFGFYLAFLLVTFPADKAYGLLQAQLSNVKAYALTGTLWSGQADALEINGRVYKEVSWSVRPMGLLAGRVEADIAFDNNSSWLKAVVAKSFLTGNVVAQEFNGSIDASELQGMLPVMPAKLAGRFQLKFDELVYAPDNGALLAAEGYIDWRDAAVTVLQEAKLGEFQVDLTTTESGVSGTFSDVNDGPLVVQGSVTLSPDKQYQLDAKLAVRDRTRQDLVQSLRFLGQQDAQGNVTFSKAGSL